MGLRSKPGSKTIKLTDKRIAALETKRKREDWSDAIVEGLRVRVTAHRHRSFRFEAWVSGKHEAVSLGTFSKYFGIAEARAKALAYRAGLNQRIALSEQLRLERVQSAKDQAATFGPAAEEFIAKYVIAAKGLRPATLRGYRWALQGSITAEWNALPLTAIDTATVRAAIHALEDDGKLAAGRLFRAYASKFFRWCKGRGRSSEIPSKGPRPPESPTTSNARAYLVCLNCVELSRLQTVCQIKYTAHS